MLLVLIVFSLQFRSVQTYVAKKAAAYLSKELKTRVEIGSLYIVPFNSVLLDSLYIEDQQKDTLLFSPEFSAKLSYFSLDNRRITVKSMELNGGKFYLKKYTNKSTNLSFILNYFKSDSKSQKKKREFDIELNKIALDDISFKYKNYNNTTPKRGINFNDVEVRNLSTTLLDLDTKNHLLKGQVKYMTFREKSGFYLKNLSSSVIIDKDQMEFKQLLIETPESKVGDYFLMKYSSFKDFSQFISKVTIQSNFKNALLNSSDIAYFSPNLSKTPVVLHVNGQISGRIKDLKAKNLMIQSGQATYVKGNFALSGLPNIKETLLDLNFEQISTNKKDIDLILNRAGLNGKSLIPEFTNKLGTINFKGRFTGFINDFIAYGEFKTKSGRLMTDLNMKIDKNSVPSYSGTVKTIDFNLGELTGMKDLGKTTLSASIKGKGFKIGSLNEEVKSNIKYLEFRSYKYSNIDINGNFSKKVFTGRINIDDTNLNLDFDGDIDLTQTLPQFNFTAEIRGAKLKELNLTKDSIQIDTDLSTNFSGSNLDNIEGFVALNNTQLTGSKNSFIVDSVHLRAIGRGTQRALTINSDILDASIKGEYDLKTLPSYFKSVANKYIPSLGLKFITPEKQSFEFSLNIKYFDPISMLFIPEMKIPQQANFNGKFVSADNVANLNGFIKLVEFRKYKINNLIIDESTSEDAMNIFITSDIINFTDSLYIKNVNIANILKRDSLNLNIKLSDKNAINQLDLNSLVEFNASGDTRIALSILPSDVVINSEVWKIQEKVSFSFDEGRGENEDFNLFRRTKIEGFELFRDDQMMTINGIISKNPEDELLIGFENFKLTTFNALTKPAGITLNGLLNGNAKISEFGLTPKLTAGIDIDSLNYNNIPVGNLSMAAGFDNASKLINVKVDVENKGETTLNIDGTYNASDDQNNLDLKVYMYDNDVVLFQPFLRNLVSNMFGRVSADLVVTGKLIAPQINGNLSLKDAGMTVNYLKTPYKISDKVEVENTVIKLNNLKLQDIRNNEAIANGTVNLNNLRNPEIHVNIVSNKFMALNTTAKDNPLYYGVAYGTGTFRFNGPVNDMRIVIDAKTEAGTIFNIPLNSSATVSKNDFITFVGKDTTQKQAGFSNFKGLTMDFDLTVDENSEVNIFTDLGKLSGRGTSELSLNITSLGDFELYGEYLISSGKFQFTAQDFINKNFKINQGGSIRWTGDPMEAAINMKALYEVRTSTAPLYQAAGRPSRDEKVPVEAVMNLSGQLLTPNISFDINFPANAYIKDELQSYLGDVNNTNQQALSLIVRRSFASGSGTDIGALGGMATETFISAGTELFFNQLNTILTQSLNLNFVDFNIRSLNDASASFRLLNDRLILTGGVTDRSLGGNKATSDFNMMGNGNMIARDVEALYLIKKNGDLVLRASNRLNNRSFLNMTNLSNDDYVSAIGLVYRKDFDSFKELLSFLLGSKRKEERQNTELNPGPDNSALKPEEIKVKNK